MTFEVAQTRLLILFLWIFPLQQVLSFDADLGLSKAQLEALWQGEVVVIKLPSENDAGVHFKAFKKLGVSPEALKPVFIDCERFKEFMPRTLKSSVSKKTENRALCEVVVDMPFPYSDLSSVVDTQWGAVSKDRWVRRWQLVEGSFHRNEGSWTIISTPNPKESIVIYEASVDPKIAVPDFILRRAQLSTIPDLMDAVFKRATSI